MGKISFVVAAAVLTLAGLGAWDAYILMRGLNPKQSFRLIRLR
jgi:hypothetical protein